MMVSRFMGKVAVITGSTTGIGYAIAQRLAMEGAKVVVSSRKQENVDDAVQKLALQGYNVVGAACHVTNPEQRSNLFKLAENTFGGIDILIASAGVNPSVQGVLDCEESAWDKVFEVNVKASYLLAKEVLPYLKRREGGKIIFNTTIAVYHSFKMLGAYTASKMAIVGLAKTAAVQLAKDNIQVNCIAPGLIDTRFSKVLTNDEVSRRGLLSEIPLSRAGTPEEVAGVAAFLASDDANYITGESIVVAGGMGARI